MNTRQYARIIMLFPIGALSNFGLGILSDVAWFLRLRHLSLKMLRANDRVLDWILRDRQEGR